MKPLREFIADQERWYFQILLGEKRGNMKEVAKAAGYDRTNLYRKLKKLGLEGARQKLLGEFKKAVP